MQCMFEEGDVVAQMRVGKENDEGVQRAKQQACQQSPTEAILEVSFFQPELLNTDASVTRGPHA